MADVTFEPKEILDLESGLSRVRGKKSIYKRMLGLFKASEEFAAFDGNIAAKDYAKASENAHAIKGMTGNLGMNALLETSEKLMVQLRDGGFDADTMERYQAALAQTRQAVEDALPGLEE